MLHGMGEAIVGMRGLLPKIVALLLSFTLVSGNALAEVQMFGSCLGPHAHAHRQGAGATHAHNDNDGHHKGDLCCCCGDGACCLSAALISAQGVAQRMPTLRLPQALASVPVLSGRNLVPDPDPPRPLMLS
jgi:hypothetical protein